jgi:hypothetical protein
LITVRTPFPDGLSGFRSNPESPLRKQRYDSNRLAPKTS